MRARSEEWRLEPSKRLTWLPYSKCRGETQSSSWERSLKPAQTPEAFSGFRGSCIAGFWGEAGIAVPAEGETWAKWEIPTWRGGQWLLLQHWQEHQVRVLGLSEPHGDQDLPPSMKVLFPRVRSAGRALTEGVQRQPRADQSRIQISPCL